MTATDQSTTERTRRHSSAGVIALTIAGLASLVLSPITAVWALLLGPLLVLAGLVVSGLRLQGRGMLLMYAGAGVIIGVVPYFLLAVIQA